MMLFQCSRSFGHLHQGNNALLHSRTAGAGKNNDRKFFLGSTLNHAGNLLAHHMSHTAHDEPGITDTDGSLKAFDGSLAGYNSFLKSGLFLRCLDLLLVPREI